MSENKFTWSWPLFFKGFISKSFLAVGISTAIFTLYFLGVFAIHNPTVDWIIATVWGAVLVIFVFSRALETAIENMKITAELKAGATASFNADAGKIIDAVKDRRF